MFYWQVWTPFSTNNNNGNHAQDGYISKHGIALVVIYKWYKICYYFILVILGAIWTPLNNHCLLDLRWQKNHWFPKCLSKWINSMSALASYPCWPGCNLGFIKRLKPNRISPTLNVFPICTFPSLPTLGQGQLGSVVWHGGFLYATISVYPAA